MRFKAGNFKYIKTLLIKSSLDILETLYLIYLDIATVSYPKRISCHLRFRFRFCRTFAFCQSHRSLFLSTAQCWGCQCRCTTNPKAKRGSQTEAVLPILGRRIGGKTCWETSGNTIICSAKFRGSAADVPKRHQKHKLGIGIVWKTPAESDNYHYQLLVSFDEWWWYWCEGKANVRLSAPKLELVKLICCELPKIANPQKHRKVISKW